MYFVDEKGNKTRQVEEPETYINQKTVEYYGDSSSSNTKKIFMWVLIGLGVLIFIILLWWFLMRKKQSARFGFRFY